MIEIDTLKYALKSLAGIDDSDFNLAQSYWEKREYRKGEFYNEYKSVCKYLGFIIDGVFRAYYIDAKSGEEKNMFFFSQNQIIVSFKSFVTQTPCNYFTQSMVDSTILYIHFDHLTKLYQQSHQWERLGRLIAEQAFHVSIGRTESFLFQTPEQRYLSFLEEHPTIFNAIPLYHISSYLGIQGPSLSRIRKRISGR